MIVEKITRHGDELCAIRHDLHMNPELRFEEKRTSTVVARELARLGFAVTTGLAGTGVVGTLSNGASRRSIGLRADMDALPISETTGLPYASRSPGKMHACGHDGHTTTLLGAARYLAETRVSRNVDPGEAAVITVGAFNAGSFCTIIPEMAVLDIGIRSCSQRVRDQLARRIPDLIAAQAAAFGCTAELEYELGYPVTVNSPAETAFIRDVALGMEPGVVDLEKPFMISEDFAYMLERVPGCYFMMGNGDEPDRKMLHDPGYDFNDELLVKGAALWGKLVEQFLPRA
jgi:metal-dependent amidase/aminoacylase/carboxypeptidase family protein